MDSPATSLDIAFLDTSGMPIDQPNEWAEALVEIDIDPTKWDAVRLTVNGASTALTIRKVNGRARVIADWPRSNAGTYELRAELGTDVAILRVTIGPGKLSPESFEALLTDLETRLPATVAIGLQRTGGLAGLTILPPEESTVTHEVARLRRAVQGSSTRQGLASVLRELARDPHEILESDEVWTRTELARRPHPTRLLHALRAHSNMMAGDFPARIIDQRVQPNVDVYENRLVALFHDQVVQRLLRAERHLKVHGANRLLEEVNELRAKLSSARREASFLNHLTPTTHLPRRVTMVLMKRPAYRAAFEGYLELHCRLAVRLDEPRLDLPLENLPGLYQLWGTLGSCAALLEVAATHGYQVEQQCLVRHAHNEMFVQVVPPGQTAIRLVHPDHGTVVTLSPERSYGTSGPIRSISFLQVPDISIAVSQPGMPLRLLLLDPKYKLESDVGSSPEINGRPKKVDIDKMHAYRDAIRDIGGRHVVAAACTIYPGPSVHYASGIDALAGIPSQGRMLENAVKAQLEALLSL